MAVNINKPQINLREQLKKLERPTTDRLAVKGADGVLIDELTGELNLNAIDGSPSGSSAAVDVFVYDTSKDSDGGAWRYKTQDRSWYNEELNTATRGSRREFPSVAVIVAESKRIVVYDGDDHTLPMWMVFTSEANQYGAIFNNRSVVALSAVNGSIYFADSLDSVINISFLSDTVRSYAASGHWLSKRTIADRNPSDTTNKWQNFSSSATLGYPINNVFVKVLPGAPIDEETGLPRPTIVISSQPGVSIVTDQVREYTLIPGGVVSINGDSRAPAIYTMTPESQASYASVKTFRAAGITSDGHGIVICDQQISSGYSNVIYVPNFRYNLNLTDTYSQLPGSYSYEWNGEIHDNTTPGNPVVGNWKKSSTDQEWGTLAMTSNSWNVADVDSSTADGFRKIGNFPYNTLIASIGKNYNTGWMVGKNKLTACASTDPLPAKQLITSSLTHVELTASDWTLDGGDHSLTISSGVLFWNYDGSPVNGYGSAKYNDLLSFQAGTRYQLKTKTVSGGSNRIRMRIVDQHGNVIYTITNDGTSATNNYKTFTPTTDITGYFLIMFDDVRSDWQCDNIFITSETDHSTEDRGLQVVGTVDKTPVADGAELMGYGGFTANDYLERAFVESSEDPGSGPYHFITWAKTAQQITQVLFSIRDYNNSNNWIQFWFDTNEVEFGQNSGRVIVNGFNYYDDVWHCYAGTRTEAGYIRLYVDGRLVGQVADNSDPNLSSSSQIKIGVHYDRNHHVRGQMALCRYGISELTQDQVTKIYEEEKHLFRENAQCALYGDSNLVNDMATDTTTDILHVGTSDGRSSFLGLKRVENTTTPVTTALSASNGLVIEQ